MGRALRCGPPFNSCTALVLMRDAFLPPFLRNGPVNLALFAWYSGKSETAEIHSISVGSRHYSTVTVPISILTYGTQKAIDLCERHVQRSKRVLPAFCLLSQRSV